MSQRHRPTMVEIDLSAIEDNIRAIRRAVGPNVKIMPAVKADGYGHGAIQVSRAALGAGADVLGVASVEEAMEIRDAGIAAPILILGCSLADSAEAIVANDIAATACSQEFGLALSSEAARLQKPARVHVKVDTGMGRIGVPPQQAVSLAAFLSSLPGVCVDGIFTHFPSADETDRAFTLNQIAVFQSLIAELQSLGIRPPLAHSANSGGVLDYPDSFLDMVRPGIIVYGLHPSPASSRSLQLRPALTFKTRIVFLKDLPAGGTVSYGRRFVAKRPTRVATIAVGYADGYSRQLSGIGEVAVRGKKAPVIGTVCMDQTMIDVTEVAGVELGDEVILMGDGFDYLSVERIAEAIGTVPHDVTCSIGKRVPRVFV